MSIIDKIIRTRVLQHLSFWSISFYILLTHFQTSSQLAPTDYIYTGLFGGFLFIMVYINLLLLVPKFFQKGRYVYYLSILTLCVALMVYLQIVLFDVIVEGLFPGYYLISYIDFWGTLKYFVIFIGISSLLHFSKSWFLYRESEAKLVKIQKEKAEAELGVLKNQINPHFLFNSLNSIYSLVLKKSENAPEALIKLSDTMRYIIYESNNERVELSKEVEFVTNYIELQKLRMSAKDKLDFLISENIGSQKIAPLLLIPIIENCFKYGIKGETESSFVEIKIDTKKSFISLYTKNNIGSVDDIESIKSSGTGLKNLKKRLELIYPNNYNLKITQSNDNFIVDLDINL
jgi:hypothetical protein